MIDNFALAISHGLIMLAAWLLLRRPDLDQEAGPDDSGGGTREAKARPKEKPGA